MNYKLKNGRLPSLYERYKMTWIRDNVSVEEISRKSEEAQAAVKCLGYKGSFDDYVRESGGFKSGMFMTEEEFLNQLEQKQLMEDQNERF